MNEFFVSSTLYSVIAICIFIFNGPTELGLFALGTAILWQIAGSIVKALK